MLRVHLLGRLSVTAGDAVVDEAELPGRQGRLALVFLVCHRARPFSRAELAEALWSHHPPRGWEPLLSTVVSRLRAALPAEAVISSGPGYYQFTGQVWGRRTPTLDVPEQRAFTYFLFKHRVAYCLPPRVASDTKRGLAELRRQYLAAGRPTAFPGRPDGMFDEAGLPVAGIAPA